MSTFAPSFGEVNFRSETGGPDDFHATFRAGRRHTSHHNADHGHIDLIAFGVPLAIDSGSGPYDDSIKTWNRQTMAHNTVRCVVPEPESTRDQSGVFQAFGSSATVDYAAGSTGYGQTSVRHVVFMKGDYMVVWDQITAAQYSDWFFHTPADTSRPDAVLDQQGVIFTTGDFTLEAGGSFKPNTTSPLTAAGTVSLSGALELAAPADLAPGASFILIRNNGGSVNGRFAGLSEGSVFPASGCHWVIRYAGGDGNDVVVTVATALQTWRLLHFGTTDDIGQGTDLADSNHDGEANLIEFATGQNPHAAKLTAKTLEENGASLEFTHTRSLAALADGVTFRSDTLAPVSWSTAGVTERIIGDDGTVRAMIASVPSGGADRRFVRLRTASP